MNYPEIDFIYGRFLKPIAKNLILSSKRDILREEYPF